MLLVSRVSHLACECSCCQDYLFTLSPKQLDDEYRRRLDKTENLQVPRVKNVKNQAEVVEWLAKLGEH